MTPAEEMRTAAEKLRTLKKAVEDDMAANPYWWLEPKAEAYAIGVANALGGPGGDLASAMNLRVVAALAVALDAAAVDAEMVGPDGRLLALARELLGTPPGKDGEMRSAGAAGPTLRQSAERALKTLTEKSARGEATDLRYAAWGDVLRRLAAGQVPTTPQEVEIAAFLGLLAESSRGTSADPEG